MQSKSRSNSRFLPLINGGTADGFFLLDTFDLFFESPNRENCPCYSLILVKKGCAIVWVDGHQCAIESGVVYIMRPGQNLLLYRDNVIDGHVLSFSREFLFLHVNGFLHLLGRPLFNYSKGLPILSFTTRTPDIIDRLMESIITEAGGQLEGRAEIIGSLLKLFMLYLSRQNEKKNEGDLPSRRTLLIDRFYRLLERNFMTLRLTSQYASELSISASYLNEIVKSTSGFSASYHIQKRITQEAKKMAILQEASMKEIAYNLGFFDPAHFSKYFKNCTGKSFSDFRRGVGIVRDQYNVIA